MNYPYGSNDFIGIEVIIFPDLRNIHMEVMIDRDRGNKFSGS
jgi:hypothetical protein